MDRSPLPSWLSTPVNLAALVAAAFGAIMFLRAAADGDYGFAVWGVIGFVVAGALWHVAEWVAREA